MRLHVRLIESMGGKCVGGCSVMIVFSDVVFPENILCGNMLKIFRKIFHSGKISVAYFYILQYYIHIYISHLISSDDDDGYGVNV